MGGRQIGNRTIDNSYQNQSGVASLHREDNGHHTHACKGHHKEIPVAHVKLLGNTSGQAGGNDARNAVAGNNHAALDRAETDALDIFIGPGMSANPTITGNLLIHTFHCRLKSHSWKRFWDYDTFVV